MPSHEEVWFPLRQASAMITKVEVRLGRRCHNWFVYCRIPLAVATNQGSWRW